MSTIPNGKYVEPRQTILVPWSSFWYAHPMGWVYILQSLSTGRFYVGCTVDLERRLAEHRRKHSPYTRQQGPWELVYEEESASLVEARRRERELKSWKSHRALQELIEKRGHR